MMGDQELVKKIQAEIDLRFSQSQPKKQNTSIKVNTVLNDDSSSAISVYEFLNKAIGEDWWELEFETIEKLLWINYGCALEEINRDKIWAIRHVCRSDGAFSDWFEFTQVALSFSGSIADFEYLRSPSPGMIISTVKSLNHIRPDREGFFGNDIIKYICIILRDNGIYTPPPSLNYLISEEMNKMISQEMRSQWDGVLTKLKEIVEKKTGDVEETIIDIQAKRILKAEAAAIEYGSR